MNDTEITEKWAAGIRLALVQSREWLGEDGRRHRREEWSITGGKIDPLWRRDSSPWLPSSHFTLYVIDGEVDPRLSSYGGVVWPTAWPKLFHVVNRGTLQEAVVITDEGLLLRGAALHVQR